MKKTKQEKQDRRIGIIVAGVLIFFILGGALLYGYLYDWTIHLKSLMALIILISVVLATLFVLRGEIMFWFATIAFFVVMLTICALTIFFTGALFHQLIITW